MGAGQGFERGVQSIGSLILPALQMRMQQKRYDADREIDKQRYDQQNERYDKRLSQMDKQYYDRMALDQAWKEGFYGGPSMLGGESPAGHAAQIAPPSPAQPTPYQVTRNQTPAEALAGQFTDPNPGYPAGRQNETPAWTNPNPPSPAGTLATTQAAPTMMSTHAKPMMSTFRGPSPSSTPFSTASSNPHTEQRTLNAPKDPSMVIKRMPDVTHEAPNLQRITPGTPLPPQSMMRPQPFRQSVRRGY